MELPPGYVELEVEGATLVIQDAVREALLAAGIHDPQALVARSPAAQRGRAALGAVELPDGRALVRPLTRGGALGKVVRRTSLDRERARRELLTSAGAAARGARVLEVLAAVTRKSGVGFEHAVVTREVPGARDLLAVLRAERGPARRRALREAGRAVRALHEAGVDHVDLNVKNVLFDAEGRALVIDLDRCALGPEAAPWPVRERNLLRLLRSWTKVGAADPDAIELRDPLRLAHGYAGEDRALRRRLRAAGAGERFPWRRLWWRLKPPRLAPAPEPEA
ncbi:MAG: lipopolysaccharide kinase InaA family protein [Planctomycetota bacterium]